MNFMKIGIVLGFIINMVVIITALFFLSHLLEGYFFFNMNNFMFVGLLSFMLAWLQIIWIKAEPSSWIKMMQNVFGVDISAE